MGIMDFIKGELLEVIEWTDDSRDTLSWQFPDEDKAIKNGAQLIVRESQVAQFVYLGQFGDTFQPGKHTLTTDNIPVLTKIKSWPFGFNSPFKADVYFVITRLFTGNKWGTSNPVMLRDNDFGLVRVRAFGTYDFKIVDPKTFLREVAGSDHNFRLDEFADTMRSRIVSIFTDAMATAKVPVLDVASRYTELGDALLPLINPAVTRMYGLEITSFIVENVSVPPEVEAAIDKRSSMAAIGNLNDFVKYQMGKGFESGGGGARGRNRRRTRRRFRPRPADDAAGPGRWWRDANVERCSRRYGAGSAEPGRCRQGAGRVGVRRHGGARLRRTERQEDRHDLANLASRAQQLPVAITRPRSITSESFDSSHVARDLGARETRMSGLRRTGRMESVQAKARLSVLRH